MNKYLFLALSLITLCFNSAYAVDESLEDQFVELRDRNAISRIPVEFRNKITITEDTEEEIKLYCSLKETEEAKCDDLGNFKKPYYFETTSAGLIGRYEDVRDLSCLLFKLEGRSDDLPYIESILEIPELDPNVLSSLMNSVIKGSISSPELISKIINHPNYNSNLLYGNIIGLQSSELSDEINGKIVKSLLRSKAFSESPEYFSKLILKYSQISNKVSGDQKLANLKDILENGQGLPSNELLYTLSQINTNQNIDSLTLQILETGSLPERIEMLRTLSSLNVRPELKSAELDHLVPLVRDEKEIRTLLNFVSTSAQDDISLSGESVSNLITKAEALSSTSPGIYSQLSNILFEKVISNSEKLKLTKSLLDIGTNDEASAYNLSYKIREFQSSGFIREDSEAAIQESILKLPQTDKVKNNVTAIFLNSSPSEKRANYILDVLNSDISETELTRIGVKVCNERHEFSSKVLSKLVRSPKLDEDLAERIFKEINYRKMTSKISQEDISIAKDMLELKAFASYKEELIRITTGKGSNGEVTTKPMDF